MVRVGGVGGMPPTRHPNLSFCMEGMSWEGMRQISTENGWFLPTDLEL